MSIRYPRRWVKDPIAILGNFIAQNAKPSTSFYLPLHPYTHSGMSRKTDLWADGQTGKLQIPHPIEGPTRTRRFYPRDGRGQTSPE